MNRLGVVCGSDVLRSFLNVTTSQTIGKFPPRHRSRQEQCVHVRVCTLTSASDSCITSLHRTAVLRAAPACLDSCPDNTTSNTTKSPLTGTHEEMRTKHLYLKYLLLPKYCFEACLRPRAFFSVHKRAGVGATYQSDKSN